MHCLKTGSGKLLMLVYGAQSSETNNRQIIDIWGDRESWWAGFDLSF